MAFDPLCPSPQAVELSELVLECLSRPGPEMAAHTVDFLLMANTGGWVGGWVDVCAWASGGDGRWHVEQGLCAGMALH